MRTPLTSRQYGYKSIEQPRPIRPQPDHQDDAPAGMGNGTYPFWVPWDEERQFPLVTGNT